MQTNHRNLLYGVVGLTAVLCLGLAAAEDVDSDARAPARRPPAAVDDADDAGAEAVPRVSLDIARDRARLMHDIYSATLATMHHRYFRGDRAVVPARAMEDVFQDIERQYHSQSRWISASFSPMSINHEPKTEFEKQAARKIAKGEDGVETIEGGYYRRTGSISLNGGCISCHSGFFTDMSPSRKFAGLIISIPVDRSARLKNEDLKSAP